MIVGYLFVWVLAGTCVLVAIDRAIQSVTFECDHCGRTRFRKSYCSHCGAVGV